MLANRPAVLAGGDEVDALGRLADREDHERRKPFTARWSLKMLTRRRGKGLYGVERLIYDASGLKGVETRAPPPTVRVRTRPL